MQIGFGSSGNARGAVNEAYGGVWIGSCTKAGLFVTRRARFYTGRGGHFRAVVQNTGQMSQDRANILGHTLLTFGLC